MNKDFLLSSELSKKLFDLVKDLPIIDYHNHLSVSDIAEDKVFGSITELWLSPDPYKHRAMRILGVPEKYITGDADDFEKFEKWYGCLPSLVGNPLFDWAVMEFKTVFEIELLPFSASAKEVYEKANEKLKTLTSKDILAKFKIEYSAPCASLLDDLSLFDRKALCPSLRGDDIVAVTPEFISRLEALTGTEITDLKDFGRAVETRIIAFKEAGCRFSDHALDCGFTFTEEKNAEEKFRALLRGEKADLSSHILKMLACLYAKHGLSMQLHIGAQRETSTRLLKLAGKAGGFAAIGNTVDVKSLTSFLDEVEKGEYGLPKTVLFTLNPADNAVLATLSGSYSKDDTPSVVTQGPAWWWCDHIKGMTDMLENFAVHSVLSTFIGMTTDSRSLLSFVRHDYFRRVFCSFLAEKAEKGEYPNDLTLLEGIAVKCCYQNAKDLI